MGKPVVASNLGGIIEIVQHGIQGLLVPPNDANALAHALATLLDNEKQLLQMGKNAQIFGREHFNSKININKTIQVYEELLKESNF